MWNKSSSPIQERSPQSYNYERKYRRIAKRSNQSGYAENRILNQKLETIAIGLNQGLIETVRGMFTNGKSNVSTRGLMSNLLAVVDLFAD